MSNALQFSQFLSAEKTRELEVALSELAHQKADNYVGVWDAQSGFCVVVEVMGGAPFQWHVRGPLNVEGAKLWLGMVAAEITAPGNRGAMH